MKPTEEIFEDYLKHQEAIRKAIQPNYKSDWKEDIEPVPGSGSGSGLDRDYVEIAGIKWATMNLGATDPTEIGLYFQWGDTQGYTPDEVRQGEKQFNWANYKYCSNGGSGSGSGNSEPYYADMSKYNYIDKKTVLDPIDDAVTAAWGSNWRMPTAEEYTALLNATYKEYIGDKSGSGSGSESESGSGSGNSNNGYKLIDKLDSSKILFFPAGGCCSESNIEYKTWCEYWTSSVDEGDARQSCKASFQGYTHDLRYCGLLIRGVVNE